MRTAILTAFTVIAIGASIAPAAARDYPYCLQGRQTGYPGDCGFDTYEQCQATASGRDAYCGINPRFAFARQDPRGWNPERRIPRRAQPRYDERW
jgi:hypothetical protein